MLDLVVRDDLRVMLALALFVAMAILAFPRHEDRRWFKRWHPGEQQHYWYKAGGWELFGIGLLIALLLAAGAW